MEEVNLNLCVYVHSASMSANHEKVISRSFLSSQELFVSV